MVHVLSVADSVRSLSGAEIYPRTQPFQGFEPLPLGLTVQRKKSHETAHIFFIKYSRYCLLLLRHCLIYALDNGAVEMTNYGGTR